jgi:hypothetical protein
MNQVMHHIGEVLAVAFAGLFAACGSGYLPTFSSVDVSCASSDEPGQGTWTLSAWVEDGDGSDDVTRVDVSVLDFAGDTLRTIPLTHARADYWFITETEDELGISCADRDLYCFTFTATDSGGQEAARGCDE